MERLIPEKLPRHIAIILDGNGRWAKKRNLSRIEGHRKGADSVRKIVRACREIGIPVLTLYVFSEENWKRPQEEVWALMELLKDYLRSELKEMLENDIKLMASGNLHHLPQDVYHLLMETMEATRHNSRMILNLALSYGGRTEILDAIRKIMWDYKEGLIRPEDITAERFSSYLYTADLPDPDLLIRTSGEFRISNFLLWQIAYTELYITDTLWPDFAKEDLIMALVEYQNRERRFGLTGEQIEASPCVQEK
ncbi:MAG TPA: isoprenyl transferase [Syntrophaceae bacterium]|nr:isoprenyl transferase [Syntrophaceae bacterium]